MKRVGALISAGQIMVGFSKMGGSRRGTNGVSTNVRKHKGTRKREYARAHNATPHVCPATFLMFVQRYPRKGTNGVSTNGVTAIFVLFDRGNFLGTPVDLLLSSHTCQGVPFSPICQNSLLLQRPHWC